MQTAHSAQATSGKIGRIEEEQGEMEVMEG